MGGHTSSEWLVKVGRNTHIILEIHSLEGIIQPLHASAGFSETFLGNGTDGDFFDVWEGWSARFAFYIATIRDFLFIFFIFVSFNVYATVA